MPVYPTQQYYTEYNMQQLGRDGVPLFDCRTAKYQGDHDEGAAYQCITGEQTQQEKQTDSEFEEGE